MGFEEQQSRLRGKYAQLIDPQLADADAVKDVAHELDSDDMRSLLCEVYEQDPSLTSIELHVAGLPIGVTSRHLVCIEPGVAGDVPIGEGDRASQAGDSTQYRIIEFFCKTCGSRSSMSFYDERRVPKCANHGSMELRR